MIRWILIILVVIVLMFAVVFIFRSINSPDDPAVTEETAGEVANGGNSDSNQNPIVVGDSFSTAEGQPVSGNVLTNDVDPQEEELVVTTPPINGPNNGTLQLNPDGSFTYTPNPGHVGTDGFTYEACDTSGNCMQGTVQITINSAADAAAGEAAPDAGQGGEEVAAAPESPDASGEEGAATTTDPNASTDNNAGGGTPDTPVESTDNTASTPPETESTTNTDTSNTTTLDSSETTNTSPAGEGEMTHVVKQGEWLIQIARCYGTAPETIRYDNYIPYPGWIMPDEELIISDVGSVSEPFYEPCIMFYTVQQGDTLYSIAETYQVELDMLLKANFGCYGYGYYYHPPVPTPYEEEDGDEVEADHDGWYPHPWYGYGPGYGAHSPYIYNGCYFPSYYNPTIYIDQELVIPVNLDNAGMR